ncbi:hypothetical protein GCM10023224_43150 [Streptomonospora halophila]|uniref:DUF5667 domain-containing protein n=1 Tax=Streptomonospora halophila TaxID=427369 RepID=A0ABP9GU21_9ACTN
MTADKTERFEDRLLAELKKEVALNAAERAAERRPAARRLVTLPRVGMALAGGAAVAAGFVVVPGMTATPAYAIEEKSNGGVRLTLADMSFDKGQQRELAADLEEHGVNVEVRNPEVGMACSVSSKYDGMVGMLRTMTADDSSETEEPLAGVARREASPGSPELKDLQVDMDLTDDHTLVIENVVPREGAAHMSTFSSIKGDPPPCDPVPYPQPPPDDD